MRGARRDHREAIRQLRHAAIDDHRAVIREHLGDPAIELVARLDQDALPAVRLAELDEIGQRIRIALGIAALIGELLPLADHAHILVVEDEDLHRQPVLRRGGQLLDVHLDRRLAGDVDHQGVRVAELRTDRGGQAVPHRAETTAGQPLVRLLKPEMLRGPHLVLADFGRDDWVARVRRVEQRPDRALRHDLVRIVLGKIETLHRTPACDPTLPVGRVGLGMLAALPDPHHVLERMADVRDDPEIDAHGLVHRRAIDVDMHFPRVRAERIEPPRHAVVEARAERDDEVGLVHRHVRLVGAVHPEHAEPLRTGRGIGAEAHQRRRHRRAGDADEFAQQLARGGPRVDDAAAGVQDRTFGRGEHVHQLLDLRLVGLHLRAIGLVLDRPRLLVARGRDLHVLGDVDDHRPWTPRGGDVERFVDHVA